MKSILIILLTIFSFLLYGQTEKNKTLYDFPIPKTIEKCFEMLDKTLSKDEILLIKTLSEDSIYYHEEFQYGTDFFHAWKIYEGSRLTKYFNEKGLFSPNDIYETILISYHRYLNKEVINLEQQIEKYTIMHEKEALINSEKSIEEQNEKFLYKAIRACLSSFINKRKEFAEAGITNKFCHFTICIDGFPPKFYFEQAIENIKINYISLTNYQPYEKSLRKGLGVLTLSRVELNNNKLEVGLAYYNTKLLGNKNFNMVLLDSMTYIYEYSCEKQEWVLIDIKYGSH